MYCISSLLIYQLLLPVAVTGVLPVTISLLVHWFLSDHRSEALQACRHGLLSTWMDDHLGTAVKGRARLYWLLFKQ